MKHYSPTGRRNRGRPLNRLLDTWDRNGSTSGLTPWQIYDDDDDDDDVRMWSYIETQKPLTSRHNFYEIWYEALNLEVCLSILDTPCINTQKEIKVTVQFVLNQNTLLPFKQLETQIGLESCTK